MMLLILFLLNVVYVNSVDLNVINCEDNSVVARFANRKTYLVYLGDLPREWSFAFDVATTPFPQFVDSVQLRFVGEDGSLLSNVCESVAPFTLNSDPCSENNKHFPFPFWESVCQEPGSCPLVGTNARTFSSESCRGFPGSWVHFDFAGPIVGQARPVAGTTCLAQCPDPRSAANGLFVGAFDGTGITSMTELSRLVGVSTNQLHDVQINSRPNIDEIDPLELIQLPPGSNVEQLSDCSGRPCVTATATTASSWTSQSSLTISPSSNSTIHTNTVGSNSRSSGKTGSSSSSSSSAPATSSFSISSTLPSSSTTKMTTQASSLPSSLSLLSSVSTYMSFSSTWSSFTSSPGGSRPTVAPSLSPTNGRRPSASPVAQPAVDIPDQTPGSNAGLVIGAVFAVLFFSLFCCGGLLLYVLRRRRSGHQLKWLGRDRTSETGHSMRRTTSRPASRRGSKRRTSRSRASSYRARTGSQTAADQQDDLFLPPVVAQPRATEYMSVGLVRPPLPGTASDSGRGGSSGVYDKVYDRVAAAGPAAAGAGQPLYASVPDDVQRRPQQPPANIIYSSLSEVSNTNDSANTPAEQFQNLKRDV